MSTSQNIQAGSGSGQGNPEKLPRGPISRDQGQEMSDDEEDFNESFLEKLDALSPEQRAFVDDYMTDEMKALVKDYPSLQEFAVTYDKIARIKLGEDLYTKYQQGSLAVLLIRAKLKPGQYVEPGDRSVEGNKQVVWCDACQTNVCRDWARHNQENHHKHPGLALICFHPGCTSPVLLRGEPSQLDMHLFRHAVYVNLEGTGGTMMTTVELKKLERLTLPGLMENAKVQGRKLQQYRDRKAAVLRRVKSLNKQLASDLAPFMGLPELDGPGRPFTQAEIDAGPTKAAALQALQNIRRLLFPGGQTLDEKVFERAEKIAQHLEDLEDEGLLEDLTADEVLTMLKDASI
ncbi:hypothetical protein M406DRAFT_327582 [Cryphonectria parasitica EP155]|uniref:Uncharacterized protein n=1 Tax=Cryphonectria parasitica (strain ATCC 38755 / EP155) TaxID=660469 RepID=A0A9P4Y904_CRYP1|nr:uncharacterized protein M406DRAFT_327582 [Cryphonectria parasitica EP155]KAF3769179.1 hypothetical protein M406DRAFT_327582 [Cryphonectria parasitica EP155]